MFFFFGPFDTAGASIPFQPDSLADVPGLERLPEVCEKFDVEITAFGSLVRRLAFHVLRGSGEPLPDLFTLVPFLSDIDLCHSGKTEQTPSIRDAILAVVPWSECFRWEISSEADRQRFREDEANLPVIPLNKLRLPTRAGTGIEDPHGAAEDLRQKQFRLIRSEFYERSTLRREHRDNELLHAIFFLELLCAHAADLPPESHPGWKPCCELIAQARRPETWIALGSSAYLRMRLTYRIKAARAACPNSELWGKLMRESGLAEALQPGQTRRTDQAATVLASLPSVVAAIAPDVLPLISGCHLGGGVFRLDEASQSESVPMGKAAWDEIREMHVWPEAFSRRPKPELPKEQRIVAAGPRIGFIEGQAPSGGGGEHVHVEFALRKEERQAAAGFPSENLGVLAVLSGAENIGTKRDQWHSYVATPPAICERRIFRRAAEEITLLRAQVNLGKLLEVFPELLRRTGLSKANEFALQLFIVAEEEEEPSDE